jgi:hypothetical protein
MKAEVAIVTVASAVALLTPASVRADAAACAAAYEQAQEERANGHLRAALLQLNACVRPSCPRFIRDDCTRWLDQVEAAVPTVVFAVRRDDVDQTEVEVDCDGEPAARVLDGKAMALDPGLHTFAFRVPGLPTVERQVLIREGERNRLVEVDLPSSRPVPVALDVTVPRVAPSRPRSTAVYAVTGVGALGVAGFAVLGLLGNQQKTELERSCAPHCEASQVAGVRTKYLMADLSLGAGLVSLGLASYLYLSRRGPPDGSIPALTLGFTPGSSGGGVLKLARRF